MENITAILLTLSAFYIYQGVESDGQILAFFRVRLCRFCVVIRFVHPRHNGQWPPISKDFYTRSYPLHYFLILILEKEPVFPSQCWVLNKGTTGTIFITSLVWRGPWLGIEPGTSRTRCQHYTTRLSRRRGNEWYKDSFVLRQRVGVPTQA